MQLLSLLSSAAPAAPAIQVRAGTAPAMPMTGFGLLVDGLVRPLEPATARPATPGEAAAQGLAPDDAVLAGLMQAMGLAAPVASSPQPLPTVIGVPLGDGGAEGAAVPVPAGLTPAVPAMPGAALPTVAAPQIRAPAPATGPVPVPIQEGASPTPTPVVSTDTGALATPDGVPAIIVTPPAPVIAVGTVPSELQAMAVAQAGPAGLPVVRPVEGKPAPVTDVAASRSAPRVRSGPASATNATPAPAAVAGDAKPAAFRLPVGEVTAGDGDTTPAMGILSAASPDNFSLPAATGSAQNISRDLAAQAVAGPRPVVAAHVPPGLQLVGRIEQAVAQDQTTLTVQLDPEHLGRVEVKLDMQDGRVTAMIAAERPATLDLLQRDVRLIERALQQGGMQVQPDGLQFTLREGAGQWTQADQGRRGAQLYGQQAQADPAADPLAAPAAFRTDSLVDIQI